MQFQSTHPRRVRPLLPKYKKQLLWFQSTHPRRVRLILFKILFKQLCFNPRTHVGCDLNVVVNCFPLQFQSTHPRRVRPYYEVILDIHLMFQSTHPRRVRPTLYRYLLMHYSFNPRTHVGCDSEILKDLYLSF